MADTCVQGSFAFRCLQAEADLLIEATSALADIGSDHLPPPPSSAMAAAFPPIHDDKPWSGLVELMPDPDYPVLHADVAREVAPDDPTFAIVAISSMIDFEPLAIAELIPGCCPRSLALAPVCYEWAVTCSRPRLDEFGGGWCVVFAHRIEIESTGTALARALELAGADGETAISPDA